MFTEILSGESQLVCVVFVVVLAVKGDVKYTNVESSKMSGSGYIHCRDHFGHFCNGAGRAQCKVSFFPFFFHPPPPPPPPIIFIDHSGKLFA